MVIRSLYLLCALITNGNMAVRMIRVAKAIVAYHGSAPCKKSSI